jgi:hypothetical protein
MGSLRDAWSRSAVRIHGTRQYAVLVTAATTFGSNRRRMRGPRCGTCTFPHRLGALRRADPTDES